MFERTSREVAKLIAFRVFALRSASSLAPVLLSALACAGAARAHQPIIDPTSQLAAGPRARAAVVVPTYGDARGATVTLDAFDRRFVLDLEPSPVVRPSASFANLSSGRIVAMPGEHALYRGTVRGESDSAVAATVHDGALQALVRIGSEVYMFEPASRIDPAAPGGELLAFRLSDLDVGIPGVSELREHLAARGAMQRQLDGPFPAVIEIAAVADFEFFTEHGAAATQRMLDVLNQVDVIFVDQLNVTLRVSHTLVFDEADDPFSVFDSGNLFNDFRDTAEEFGEFRAADNGPIEQAGLAHLFSDKFGIIAGFGFINELCDSSRGVSISTNSSNVLSLHALVVAHELGHNFGAMHDGELGSSCATAPGGFIMAPTATGTAFSTCSKSIMTARAEAAACITEGEPSTTTTTITPPTTTTTTTTSTTPTLSTTTTTLPAQGCAQPVTSGALPTASDCLFILRTAVGSATCPTLCVCAPKGTLPTTASDALLCLKAAVGQPVTLACPC